MFELALQTTSSLSLKLLPDLVWTSAPGIHMLAFCLSRSDSPGSWLPMDF